MGVKMMERRILLGVCCFSVLISFVYSYNIVVEAGRKSCFGFNLVAHPEEAHIEIEVVKGGKADISYEILDVYNNVLKTGIKIQSNDFIFNVTKTGEYKVCLDNTFSSSSAKCVQLELSHESTERTQMLLSNFPDEEQSELLKERSAKLIRNTDRAEKFQEMILAKHKRHYYLQQSNLSRVNWFSFISCVVMIAVGVLQVFIVKSLFEDGSRKPFRFW